MRYDKLITEIHRDIFIFMYWYVESALVYDVFFMGRSLYIILLQPQQCVNISMRINMARR